MARLKNLYLGTEEDVDVIDDLSGYTHAVVLRDVSHHNPHFKIAITADVSRLNTYSYEVTDTIELPEDVDEKREALKKLIKEKWELSNRAFYLSREARAMEKEAGRTPQQWIKILKSKGAPQKVIDRIRAIEQSGKEQGKSKEYIMRTIIDKIPKQYLDKPTGQHGPGKSGPLAEKKKSGEDSTGISNYQTALQKAKRGEPLTAEEYDLLTEEDIAVYQPKSPEGYTPIELRSEKASILLDPESYTTIENFVKKIASENNIKDVTNIVITISANEGIAKFKTAEEGEELSAEPATEKPKEFPPFTEATQVIFDPHIEQHLVGDTTSGSKISRETFEGIKAELEQRVKNNDFDEEGFFPGKIYKLKSEEPMLSALKEDPAIKPIWDAEFENAKQTLTGPGDSMPSSINPKFIWVMRQYAKYPVLTKKEAQSPTNDITAIVYPNDQSDPDIAKDYKAGEDIAIVVTIFAGEPAPPMEIGKEDFWSTHYFAVE